MASRDAVREWALRAAMLAAGLLFALSAGEIAARVLAASGRDYALEMWKYARILKRRADDPALGHAHRPNASARLMGVDVHINSHGLREREIDFAKPPGTKRVLLLGDSVTFAWGARVEDGLSRVLERSLDSQGGSHWQTVDSGVGNYNTRMEVRYFEREGVRYSPDVVVLDYFINDAEPDPVPATGFLAEHSALYVFASNRGDAALRLLTHEHLWSEYYASLYTPGAPGWQGARDAIHRLGERCARDRLVCLVADLPELHRLAPYPFTGVSEGVEQAAREAGLPYLDLRPSLHGLEGNPSALWVSAQDAHPNAIAHARYGEALAGWIRAHVPSP